MGLSYRIFVMLCISGFLLAMAPAASLWWSAQAVEAFHKLTGAQINAKVTGMEITDNVHWGDTFERNGTLSTISMGQKSSGKWRVKNNQLCLQRGKDPEECLEMWVSNDKIELRREGTLPYEGVLRKPTRMN